MLTDGRLQRGFVLHVGKIYAREILYQTLGTKGDAEGSTGTGQWTDRARCGADGDGSSTERQSVTAHPPGKRSGGRRQTGLELVTKQDIGPKWKWRIGGWGPGGDAQQIIRNCARARAKRRERPAPWCPLKRTAPVCATTAWTCNSGSWSAMRVVMFHDSVQLLCVLGRCRSLG